LVETVTFAPLTAVLFFAAAIAEIGGGYLVWMWRREKKTVALAGIGAIILFVYGIIPTLQPAESGRVYAAYGGILKCTPFQLDSFKPFSRYSREGTEHAG
jgi:small multidrug resistance family-3 protein